MKRKLTKGSGSMLVLGVIGIAVFVVLFGCGGSARATIPAPVATATLTPTSSQGNVVNSDLLTRGKLIFEKTAGDVGCAYCHGLDGKGKGPAQVNAANIRGKNEGDIRASIQGGVPMMGFIKLNDDEITAVATYLRYLAAQP
ncbi:MAG: cytochrome c [Chloroflexi bacterium]|nr:cytochrome c [Chloroflexota bacterium]